MISNVHWETLSVASILRRYSHPRIYPIRYKAEDVRFRLKSGRHVTGGAAEICR